MGADAKAVGSRKSGAQALIYGMNSQLFLNASAAFIFPASGSIDPAFLNGSVTCVTAHCLGRVSSYR